MPEVFCPVGDRMIPSLHFKGILRCQAGLAMERKPHRFSWIAILSFSPYGRVCRFDKLYHDDPSPRVIMTEWQNRVFHEFRIALISISYEYVRPGTPLAL
jgi:hypothetical protein